MSKDIKDIVEFVNRYRVSLTDDVFDSQEFSIKLLQVPKVSNTNRTDLAIEFVRLDQLAEDDRKLYEDITVLVKDRKIKVEGINVGKLKPGMVQDKVNDILGNKILNLTNHRYFYTIFNVRPPCNDDEPFNTNTDYCHYDEPHRDYVFNEDWVNFIVHVLQSGILTVEQIKTHFKNNEKLNIDEYSIF